MFNIKKLAPVLQLLCSSAPLQLRALSVTASPKQVRCLCIQNFREMKYPTADGTITMSWLSKNDIYTLADPRRSFMKKKQIRIQKVEGFLDLLLSRVLEGLAQLV